MRGASLRRELAVALVLKAVAIFLLYLFFFGPSQRLHVTPSDMAAALARGSAEPR
jgi:hypothetical protein